MPRDAQEIKNEGAALHHCVGTYVDRVAKGQTHMSFTLVQNILSTITCFSQRIRKGTPSTVCLLEKGICGMEQL